MTAPGPAAVTGSVADPDPSAPARGRVGSAVDRFTTSPGLVAAASWVVLAIPLVVALIAQHRTHWNPIADLAQTELRVRDVGGRHSPLVGLAGRIGGADHPGSHAGPLSFWLLAPVYRLFGSTAFALQVSTVTLHLVALGLAVGLAARRGGVRLVLAVAATLAVVERFYGGLVLVEPWNPYLPVSWWLVVLLAAWSVLDGDLVALPAFVLAGSMASQTHLPYVGQVGGLIVVLVGFLAVSWWRNRPADTAVVRHRIHWVGGSVLFGLVLWSPSIFDQVARTGNLGLVVDTLRHPEADPVGVGAGLKAFVGSLDPVQLLFRHQRVDGAMPGSVALGAFVIVAWAVAAAVTARLGDRRLGRLHVVVGASLLFGAVSSSRVTGELWFYLFLWARGIAAFALLSIAATAMAAARRPGAPAPVARWRAPAAVMVAGAVLVGAATTGAVDNSAGTRSQPLLTANLGVIADQTAAVLPRSGRYLVEWQDTMTLGGQGFGLLSELERRGFHVGVTAPFGPGAVPYRVYAPDQVDGVVRVVVGEDVDRYEATHPGVRRLALVDRRTPAERRQFTVLMDQIEQYLRESGRLADQPNWADNLFFVALTPGMPDAIVHKVLAAVTISSSRSAVFYEPTPHGG